MSEQQAPGTQGNGQDDVTHFGFRNVPKSQKAGQVAQVFHSVADEGLKVPIEKNPRM